MRLPAKGVLRGKHKLASRTRQRILTETPVPTQSPVRNLEEIVTTYFQAMSNGDFHPLVENLLKEILANLWTPIWELV
jgi:hypothetical protein